VIALAAILIGCPIALAVNYWLSLHGVVLPTTFTYGGAEFSHMYSEINLRSFVIPAITVFLAALAVSVIPAIKAARTVPAKAMRVH